MNNGLTASVTLAVNPAATPALIGATSGGSGSSPTGTPPSATGEHWPEATVVSGDAVDIVDRLKEESKVPLRSHGSLAGPPIALSPALTLGERRQLHQINERFGYLSCPSPRHPAVPGYGPV